MCVFRVLKKWNFFSFPPSPSQWKKNLKISGRRGGGWGGWGEAGIQRVPTPPVFSPAMDYFLHSLSHCPPWILEKEVLCGGRSVPTPSCPFQL